MTKSCKTINAIALCGIQCPVCRKGSTVNLELDSPSTIGLQRQRYSNEIPGPSYIRRDVDCAHCGQSLLVKIR